MPGTSGERPFPGEMYAVPDERNRRIKKLEAERLALMAEIVVLRENLARCVAMNERMIANHEKARRRRLAKGR